MSSCSIYSNCIIHAQRHCQLLAEMSRWLFNGLTENWPPNDHFPGYCEVFSALTARRDRQIESMAAINHHAANIWSSTWWASFNCTFAVSLPTFELVLSTLLLAWFLAQEPSHTSLYPDVSHMTNYPLVFLYCNQWKARWGLGKEVIQTRYIQCRTVLTTELLQRITTTLRLDYKGYR